GAVTTVAGSPNSCSTSDGIGTAAGFASPRGLALDSATGTLYVAERDAIRQVVLSTAVVTTVENGTRDHTGNGLAGGKAFLTFGGTSLGVSHVYSVNLNQCVVTDSNVTSMSYVDLAGSRGGCGTTDNAIGSSAQFSHPRGIASDAAHTTLYVADAKNCAIRKVDVTTQ